MSRILIYSDVHGNLPAFETMLKHVGPCDGYISLGDLVNYGPWSNECVDLACSLPNSVLIMGNHEEAFIDGNYPGENKLVKCFFEHTYPVFNRLNKIQEFRNSYTLNGYTLTHTINGLYIYPDTNIVLNGNYIIGHSHHQFAYCDSGFRLFNAGSVGQNRKYINVINYMIYDEADKSLNLHSLKYNVDDFIDQLIFNKFPVECINYYRMKERF